MKELTNKEVKSVRKKHRCAWCVNWINQGDPAQYRSYIFDGFQWDWMHPECAAAMADCGEDLDEGFMPGDYPRGSTVSWDNLPEEEREK